LTDNTEILVDSAAAAAASARSISTWSQLIRNPSVIIGGTILLAMVLIAITAPLLGTTDPTFIDPTYRNKKPGAERIVIDDAGNETVWVFRMGTDTLGRDVYSRVIYGAQVSLIIGVTVAALSVIVGLVIGLLAGYLHWVDRIVMRFMDGLMAIPGILLAIALVSLWGAGIMTVILAIMIPEIPRVVRLVRAVVLSIREEPYVESAISVGTPLPMLCVCFGHPGGSHPQLPGRRYTPGDAYLGQHHGRRPHAVSNLSAQHPFPGRFSGADGTGGQYARRRPARYPGPAPRQTPEGLT